MINTALYGTDSYQIDECTDQSCSHKPTACTYTNKWWWTAPVQVIYASAGARVGPRRSEVFLSSSLIAGRWSFPPRIRTLSSSPLARRFCLTSHTRLLAAEWLWGGCDSAHLALLHSSPHAFYILFASFGGQDIHYTGVWESKVWS